MEIAAGGDNPFLTAEGDNILDVKFEGEFTEPYKNLDEWIMVTAYFAQRKLHNHSYPHEDSVEVQSWVTIGQLGILT